MIFLQVVLGLLIIVLVLLQSRGAGIGTVFGGGGETYGTRRGIEKIIFRATIVAATLFVIVSLASVIKL